MRRVVGGLVAVSLLVAGCGSKTHKTDPAASATASSTTASTAAAGSGASSTSTSTTAKAASKKATGTGQGAVASPTAKPATSSGGGSSSSSTTGSFAAPGKYTYNRTGKQTTSAFPEQSLDGQVTMQMDPPANSEQHETTTASEGTSEQTLRLLTEGAYFVDLKQSTSGFNKEFKPDPPVLAFPASATVGRTWSWTITSTDGQTTLNGSFRIDRNETLTIGGEQVQTVVLVGVLKASGDIDFTSNTTNWVAPSKGLVVRTDTTTDGTIRGVTFHQQSSQVLASTKPAAS